MRMTIVALLLCLVTISAPAQEDLHLLLHMPLDGDLTLAAGDGVAQIVGDAPAFVEGRHDQAMEFGPGQRLVLHTSGNLDKGRGTVCMWVKPHWAGDLNHSHIFLQDDLPFNTGENCIRLWHWSVGQARFDVRDEGDHYLTSNVKSWRAEEWHHIAASWDADEGTRLYLDGMLVATKLFSFEPRPSGRFFIGGREGGDDALAVMDDLRVHDRPIGADQLRRVMDGLPLERVEYVAVAAPTEVVVGQVFEATLRLVAPDGLTGPYSVAASLGSVPLGEVALESLPEPGEEATVGPLTLSAPVWAYPPEGEATLSLRVSGAAHVEPEKADAQVQVRYPATPERGPVWSVVNGRVLRDGENWRPGNGVGLLVRGEFLRVDDVEGVTAAIESGAMADALPCRLVDEVDCTASDHGYRETAPAPVEELLPGERFRLTGEQDQVTQMGKRGDREFKVLPGFSYELNVAPRPTPHVVVVESLDDEERYLEVAIDAVGTPLPHTAISGVGARDLMHMCVTYNGREYESSGHTYRESYMVFPKTARISVMITCSRHSQGLKSSAPAAVSRIRVYEVVEPLRALPNEALTPDGPTRSIGLFDPEITGMFDRYGFADAGVETRAQTLRRFIDYNRFLGFDRYELRPFQLSEKAYFATERFEQASDLDIFRELLPLARQAGMTVVPRVMYLHSYAKLVEDDSDNFQQTREGTTLSFGREGRIPDPLRPAVQQVVFDSFDAMLQATDDYRDVVPALCYDTSIGGLYDYKRGPSSDVGYSVSNVRDFCAETGLTLPAEVTDHAGRYDWLKANHWEAWLDWRAMRWHDFVCALRDRVKAHDPALEFILNQRVMPRDEWEVGDASLADAYRGCLYKPEQFREEPGVRICWFTRINADRYFGKLWWKDWFHDPLQPALTHTPEPRGHEMYYNYWELPTHPWGFRVGPGSPVGRAFFEPYTHALRTMNPQYMLVFCWFRGSYGHEAELREWARAWRALPAVEPRAFEGAVQSEPPSDDLWVRWFGDRLAVVNDSAQTRDVTLTVSPPRDVATEVYDATTCRTIPTEAVGERMRMTLTLRAWDLRTLVFRTE